MICYYLIRDTARGADCSYTPGRTLLREVYRDSHKAQRRADLYNAHHNVAGMRYLVLPHDDALPVECDANENDPPSRARAIRSTSFPGFYDRRRWDGSIVRRDRQEILSAPMSEDTRRSMTALCDQADAEPYQWHAYPGDLARGMTAPQETPAS